MDTDIQEVQLACFSLGDVLYGIDIMRIKEIIKPQKLTALPKVPTFLEGVINLRGVVIPIVDLRKRFDLPLRENNRNCKLMIVTLAWRIIGLVVDDVREVISVPVANIKPPPNITEGISSEYIIGVCLTKKETLVMLLNLDSLLDKDEHRELGVF